MGSVLLDIHDAPSLVTHLKPVIPNLQVAAINPDLPDFAFMDWQNEWVGVSLKGVNEILSGLDAVTEQLQRDVQHVSRLYLVVTGVMVPVEGGVKVVEQSGNWWREHGKNYVVKGGIGPNMPYHFSYLGYRKWLETIRLYGIDTLEPANRAAQVATLQALYEHHQAEPESHTSFTRVVRSKLSLPEDASPFVRSLMGLADAQTGRTFIGQATAEALEHDLQGERAEFRNPTLANLLDAAESWIADTHLASGRRIGPAMAKRIKEALG